MSLPPSFFILGIQSFLGFLINNVPTAKQLATHVHLRKGGPRHVHLETSANLFVSQNVEPCIVNLVFLKEIDKLLRITTFWHAGCPFDEHHNLGLFDETIQSLV